MEKSIAILLGFFTIIGSCVQSGNQKIDKHSAPVQPGKGLLDEWPDDGPELLWKYEGLGLGYGGPLVTNEGIFINAEEAGNSYVVHLDHHGKLLWRSPNGKEFLGIGFSASYPGTRSIPTIRGRYVYGVSGKGHLSCFEKSNGKVIWKVDLMNEFSGRLGDFGYSESPVVDEEKVYCFPGGMTHNIVALDRLTGDLIWSSMAKQDHFSYGTPVLLNLPNRRVLAGSSRNYIHVVDIQDGRLLSSYQLQDIREGYEHCNSVVHLDGSIYFVPCEEHGQGTVRLLLSPDGGNLSEVWRNSKVINVFEGFVVTDNWLYTTLETRKLVSLDTNTGRIRHSVRAQSGSIVYADNKLFVYGHNGRVQLFSLDNGKPELRSEMRVVDGSGHHFSFPVIADGVMYIRRGDALMAYEVR